MCLSEVDKMLKWDSLNLYETFLSISGPLPNWMLSVCKWCVGLHSPTLSILYPLHGVCLQKNCESVWFNCPVKMHFNHRTCNVATTVNLSFEWFSILSLKACACDQWPAIPQRPWSLLQCSVWWWWSCGHWYHTCHRPPDQTLLRTNSSH